MKKIFSVLFVLFCVVVLTAVSKKEITDLEEKKKMAEELASVDR